MKEIYLLHQAREEAIGHGGVCGNGISTRLAVQKRGVGGAIIFRVLHIPRVPRPDDDDEHRGDPHDESDVGVRPELRSASDGNEILVNLGSSCDR